MLHDGMHAAYMHVPSLSVLCHFASWAVPNQLNAFPFPTRALQAGQFISSRSDFVPDAICRQLLSLLDRVPPMPAALVERALQRELGRSAIEDVFAWVDYEHPLGSASVSQVHLAQLRRSSCLRVAWLRAVRFFLGRRSFDARGGVDLTELALQGPRNGLVAVKVRVFPERGAGKRCASYKIRHVDRV